MKRLAFFITVLAILTGGNAQFEDDQFDLDEGWFTSEMYNDPYFVQLRNRGYTTILPGTKWCGRGSIAKSFDDLGRYNRTDSCCRAHDNCPDIMKPKETLHGLTNPSSSTSLSCKCDREFYHCLKGNKNYPSKTIGTLYFDILKKQCFEEVDGKYVWKQPQAFSEGKFIQFLRRLL
ncbi:phospholipase A2 [Diachasma alloeum]|uniref:phospholipase A2 n=1 Tax=Diachasma alloeum TaxID=454923 RepID=UPI0007383A11|nr:phospholipase A2 [Diachasma alloeum]